MGEVGSTAERKSSLSRLWEEVWRQPWAMQVRLVMGDAMQEAGDAHGELIAVQLALERLPDDDDAGSDVREARDALEVRQTQLLRQLRPRLLGKHSPDRLTWRAGFIDSATVNDLGELSSLIDCRAAWVLRALQFVGQLDDVRDLVRRIDDGHGATIEELQIGVPRLEPICAEPFRAQLLFDALPRLRHLGLWHVAPNFESATALRLETLGIEPIDNPHQILSSLGSLHAPALKSLTIAFDDFEQRLPRALLEARGMAHLQHLQLEGGFESDAIGEVLASRLASKLKRLTLRLPRWLKWSPARVNWGPLLARLEVFEIVAPQLTATEARALERMHSNVRVLHRSD